MQIKEVDLDFSALLQTIVARITSYTQICLISVTPRLIHFKVTWMLVNRHKNYRIICSQKQSTGYLQSIRKLINYFPIRKVYISLAFLQQKKQNELQFWEQYQTLMLSTVFDQIYIVMSNFVKKEVNIIFATLLTRKVSFTEQVQFQKINYLITYIHENFIGKDINLSMRVIDVNDESILKFVSVWRETLTKQLQIQPILQKQFGSFQPNDNNKLYAYSQKQQQISIFDNEKQVLRVKNIKDFGYGLILKGKVSEWLLINLIKLISKSKQSVSLQVQALNVTTLLNVITYVVDTINESKYHISIGHQVQLTTSRLVLNTTGLSVLQVKAIFQLMKQPGHYELICYSSAEHFPAAVELFRIKPLVKFNFFLPLEQFKGERQELIAKMQRHAHQLLLKVYSYAGLCRKMGKSGYLAVNTIFYALAQSV